MYGVQRSSLSALAMAMAATVGPGESPDRQNMTRCVGPDRQREAVPIGQKRVIMAASIEGIARTSLAFPVTASVDGVKFGRNL